MEVWKNFQKTNFAILLHIVDVGPPGYIGGPNVVTIHAADFCTTGCQEYYPDEFCSQYPPEGIPAKPRTIDDWGTKFNITANMMKKGKYYFWKSNFKPLFMI